MKIAFIVLIVAVVCSVKGGAAFSSSVDTPIFPPPNYCNNGICVTYVKQSLSCHLEINNGGLYQSQEVDLHVEPGSTTLANTSPSTTTATQDDNTLTFLRSLCGDNHQVVTPCNQLVY
jgi:hypothetical protein